MCFPIQSIPPPTEGTKKAVSWLKYLAMAQGIVILLKIIIMADIGAFFELFAIFILYMAWAQLNPCNTVIYVLYCLQQVLFIFMLFGTRIQEHLPFFGTKSDSKLQAILILEFILFFFYCGACYIGFVAYKEFKIFQYDYQQSGGGLIQQDQGQQPYQQQQQQQQQYYYGQQGQQQQPTPQQSQQQQFSAFQGRSVQIG